MLSCTRPLAAVALAAAAALFLAAPVAASGPPASAWGHDPDPAVLEFGAEFDRALDRADAEFDRLFAAPETVAPVLLAHSGQLSKTDNCHRRKAAGERHWHKDGTAERGGPCIKMAGETVRLTNHAICGEQRAIYHREKESRWGVDYRHHAEALKDCILALPPPDAGRR